VEVLGKAGYEKIDEICNLMGGKYEKRFGNKLWK